MLGARRKGFQAAEIRGMARIRKRASIRGAALLRAVGPRHLSAASPASSRVFVPPQIRGAALRPCAAPQPLAAIYRGTVVHGVSDDSALASAGRILRRR